MFILRERPGRRELLLVPGGVDLDGDFVLDRNGEEGGNRDFEVDDVGGDGTGDVVGVAVDVLVELDVGVVGGLAGELDFEVAVERGLAADSGMRKRTRTMGFSAARVTCCM